ncbi:4a-hydroxytetrahydrobiopterin dehydratase [Ilumatobacter nonamiensis]|uniref:4a-hydroxytetrahydrobiopterin dehydratase n=1 Tax=Ilumatobacter nonamiensis TaxID=467093 RepID=UPI0003468853|nr:4a-hydroxytetrahydrobiopterin dehydratase [Ilumatobacter nonamiensis]
MSWTETDGALHRDFEFDDFRAAFAFMTRVAFIAEDLDHHPNWSNVYNTVSIALTSHDAGNTVTDRDRTMSEAIDALVD